MKYGEDRKLIVLGLNLDYFSKTCNEISEKNYGEFNNLGILFYLAFIR